MDFLLKLNFTETHANRSSISIQCFYITFAQYSDNFPTIFKLQSKMIKYTGNISESKLDVQKMSVVEDI